MLHVNCIKRTLVILGLRGTVWNMTLICSGWFTPEYSPTYLTLALPFPPPPFLVRMMGFHNDSSIFFPQQNLQSLDSSDIFVKVIGKRINPSGLIFFRGEFRFLQSFFRRGARRELDC